MPSGMSHFSDAEQLHTLQALISEEGLPGATVLEGSAGNGVGHTSSKTDSSLTANASPAI